MPPNFALTPARPQALERDLRQIAANRLGEPDMRHDAVAEEGVDAMPRAIDELIGDNEVQRPMLFLQRADGRERQNALDAKLLHAMNVGAIVDLGRRETMPVAVARQKRDLAAFQRAQHVGVGRRAEWRV